MARIAGSPRFEGAALEIGNAYRACKEIAQAR